MKKLDKQQQLLEFIKKYVDDNGYPPTVREMCRAVKVNSTSTIAYHLSKLEEDGFIRKNPNKNRALEVVSKDVVSGFSKVVSTDNSNGLTMNAGIFNGDQIIVRQQSYADNGEIVAALIDGSATVKRFYKENGHYRLQPENDTMSPIIVDEVQILGKVIGLVRKF